MSLSGTRNGLNMMRAWVSIMLRSLVPMILGGVLLATGCAGYQIGNRSLYRNEIRTVYVPIFVSDSFRRNLGERLTEAVVKEIENKTPYQVVSDPTMADSVLTGRLFAERNNVLAENVNDQPRVLESQLTVLVNWVDRQGFAITQQSQYSLAQQGITVVQAADYLPEAGQSVGVAHQEAIRRVAEQIVAQMESPW